jgi:CheY-like chemotaxis protein
MRWPVTTRQFGSSSCARDEWLDFGLAARQAQPLSGRRAGRGVVGETEQAGTTPPRILIVEDEPLIALMLTDMLADLGFQVVASVTQVADALTLLADMTIDIALLDVNIGAQKIDPVADLLAERGTPFIFTTGYGNAGVPSNHADRPILQKPFQFDDLAAAVRRQLGIAEG